MHGYANGAHKDEGFMYRGILANLVIVAAARDGVCATAHKSRLTGGNDEQQLDVGVSLLSKMYSDLGYWQAA